MVLRNSAALNTPSSPAGADVVAPDDNSDQNAPPTWRQRLIETARQAETWRRGLLEARREAECWRDRVGQLTRDAETRRQALQDGQAETAALTQALDLERRQIAAMIVERDALRHALAVSHGAVAERDDRIADLHRYIDGQHQRLHDVWSSASWRLTIPLRSLSRRVPALSRATTAIGRGAWRLIWREATAPTPAASVAIAAPDTVPEPSRELAPASPSAKPAASALPPSTPVSRQPATHWLFLGDTIDWLQVHRQLSGVGKVTSELFLTGDPAAPLVPCALAPTDTGLASISHRDTAAYLALRSGRPPPADDVATVLPPSTASAPAPGDHVLFTGVVWTPSYAELFRSLHGRGVRVSVLVYDLIPIVEPEWVDDGHRVAFEAWLGTVMTHASCVFVSGAIVRDHVLRWASLCGLAVSAQVVTIEFGTRALPDAAQPAPGSALAAVRLDDFVLCVGTVDRRKNQAMLCRVWRRLIDDLGEARVPQLVLVGRDDLRLEQDDLVAPMLRAGQIVLLQGLADPDLDILYAGCRFTAFPSRCEGYGLPVSESLAFGKLCIASDLAVVREHAGDLPWYVPPEDEPAAYAVVHRAVTDTPAREAAEARIRDLYRPRSWRDTVATIGAHLSAPRDPVGDRPRPEWPPGIPTPTPRESLRRAERWCTDAAPVLSFIIVNRNASSSTRACIQNIWATTRDLDYEIIIVDDGGDPVEHRVFGDLGRGVRLLPLGTTRFFGEACNIAAEHARGQLLCLLRPDCFGIDGWLTPLIAALDADPAVAAAGPFFLSPDLTVQDAGSTIDENGFVAHRGQGEVLPITTFAEATRAQRVDYLSATALLLRRDAYLKAGGFDLRFEPHDYEDVDLALKLAALGYGLRLCPDSRIVRLVPDASPAAGSPRSDLNRAKLLSRWGRYLGSRNDADLKAVASTVLVGPPLSARADASRTAALYTPYALTPGGGERFLLTIAAALIADHRVTIVTPHPYSDLRLQAIAHEFGLDISRCHTQTEITFLADPAPDLLLAIGNHIVPPIRPHGDRCFFVCQFPVPSTGPAACDDAYRSVLAYSDYAKVHIEAALSAHRMPKWPVEVIYPPVPQMAGRASAKKPILLTVGRFFAGAHNKRHDLMIDAFRRLLERHAGDLELHIVGSSIPLPTHLRYLEDVMRMAEGLPVKFHVNAAPETLCDLYRDAAIYWHAAGLGADLVRAPELAEHFGISLVEAMSAECVALAFNAGGPREIVTHAVDGYLYASADELVTLTADLLRPGQAAHRQAIGEAAGRRAQDFAPSRFERQIRRILVDRP